MMLNTEFLQRIGPLQEKIEKHLQQLIDQRYSQQDALNPAIAYALQGRGKRVRPLLCLLAAESLDLPVEQALDAAVALEMVHIYSLVHDDLPCMDDDDLRRGRPTVHKVYGEACALLVGDALLADAFAVLTDRAFNPDTTIGVVAELARAAGGGGMCLGQALDLHWTARAGASVQDLDAIHLRKTGYLLGAATAMGALLAGADSSIVERYRQFGCWLGLAFQVQDDLLDDAGTTGKSSGKDKANGKLTYLAKMSRPEAEKAAQHFTHKAEAMLQGLAASTPTLLAFSHSLLTRRH